MKRFNAGLMVVVFATLGASAPAGAKVSASQGEKPAMVAPAAQVGAAQTSQSRGLQAAVFYAPSTISASTSPTAAVIDNQAPDTERANMGMMVLVGLGMVGTLVVKSNRT